MADLARLNEVIEPEAKALGFDLVRVKMMPSEAGDGGQALQIMAEDPATGQLVIDQCAALSRRVSDRIDELEEQGEVLIEGAYHLEVSSPGIDRPLTRPKDYANWAGHEAKISMVKGYDGQRTYKGDLKGLDNGRVTIVDTKAGEVSLPLEEIHSAKLVLTDALIAATQPLDTSGAEDIEEEKADD
ncbi:ribosome maturation protein RimP [Qipengyuania gaetbuli]|uniref:ribosome maturation protein RimP n=1 Tax=Qipengyuania gaetbuli TaxID=266952 RepID=UPI001CFF21D2|nr:ribosome maturation protein RimP [Qipengyuania gaetbuli]